MAFEQVTFRTRDGQQYGPVSMAQLMQWRQENRVPPDAVIVDAMTGEERPVNDMPTLLVPPPPMPGTPGMAAAPGTAAAPSAFDKIIPTKNAKALVAYYCGIFGLIPCVSFGLGPVALIFGILGLRDSEQLRVGSGHAWAGIILGGLETLGTLAAVGLIITGALQE